MITRLKEIFIATTIALMSCAGSENMNDEQNPDQDSTSNQHVNVQSVQKDSVDVIFTEDCESHFQAAMNQEKPEDVVILNCNYWSSEHPVWLEHDYSFEIAKNEAFLKEILDYNQMIEMTDTLAYEQHRADWFLPKPAENYSGFYTEDDFDDFQVFTDQKTGTIYIRGSQY